MTVSRLLARGRRRHLVLMRDTILVERRTGRVTDPVTGEVTDTYAPVHSGPADVRPADAGSTDEEADEREIVLRRYDARLPFDTPDVIQVGDRFTVTASEDTWLAGRPMVVVAVGHGSRRTARHVIVEDQEQPHE